MQSKSNFPLPVIRALVEQRLTITTYATYVPTSYFYSFRLLNMCRRPTHIDIGSLKTGNDMAIFFLKSRDYVGKKRGEVYVVTTAAVPLSCSQYHQILFSGKMGTGPITSWKLGFNLWGFGGFSSVGFSTVKVPFPITFHEHLDYSQNYMYFFLVLFFAFTCIWKARECLTQ